MTGRPRSRGSSRCSTDAKNASASACSTNICSYCIVARMWREPVGASGVEISRIGLGGYEFGPEPDEEPDVDRAARVIGTAIQSGINWLDTSENYLATHNEEVIGRALAQIGRDDFLVASNVAPDAALTAAAAASAASRSTRPAARAWNASDGVTSTGTSSTGPPRRASR